MSSAQEERQSEGIVPKPDNNHPVTGNLAQTKQVEEGTVVVIGGTGD